MACHQTNLSLRNHQDHGVVLAQILMELELKREAGILMAIMLVQYPLIGTMLAAKFWYKLEESVLYRCVQQGADGVSTVY